MQRLVYSPSAKVWVKTDTGVVDLSPYVTECSVARHINDISKAEVHFRNPKVLKDGKPRFMFTEHENNGKIGPLFHPMDPITIVLERIAGRPIQVFTGYCDTTPYVQLFPGIARITASCTLKRLNHTYWDPGLNFVRQFMNAYGWQLRVNDGLAVNEELATRNEDPEQVPSQSVKLEDSSIGSLLYAVLNEIGGWNNDNIYIQPLPKNIAQIITKLFDELAANNAAANSEVAKFVKDIVGVGGFGALSNQPQSDAAAPGGPSPILPANAPSFIQSLKAEADRIANAPSEYQSDRGERAGNELTNIPKTSDGKLIFDCSSFVSYMINFIGKLGVDYAPASPFFTTWAEPGEGQYLTVWARGPAGPRGHVFLEFNQINAPNRFIGTTGSATAGHTVAWHSQPSDINTYTPRHIRGF